MIIKRLLTTLILGTGLMIGTTSTKAGILEDLEKAGYSETFLQKKQYLKTLPARQAPMPDDTPLELQELLQNYPKGLKLTDNCLIIPPSRLTQFIQDCPQYENDDFEETSPMTEGFFPFGKDPETNFYFLLKNGKVYEMEGNCAPNERSTADSLVQFITNELEK